VTLASDERNNAANAANNPKSNVAGNPKSNATAGNTKPNTSTTSTYNPVASTVNRNPSNVNRTKPTYTPSITPEVSELSKGFEANRGRLPWPVSNGVVIDAFGKHKHAVATRVEIENNGIDIQTSQGAKARAVFDGKITTVMGMQGSGQTVIINHGQYFTVYSGLSSVSVKVGDQISTKQILGTVVNNEDGVAVMNFQVWKGASKMNPSG
jgi:murein DD-endopeptidase MepM/ murein hydrolase activator NlpD